MGRHKFKSSVLVDIKGIPFLYIFVLEYAFRNIYVTQETLGHTESFDSGVCSQFHATGNTSAEFSQLASWSTGLTISLFLPDSYFSGELKASWSFSPSQVIQQALLSSSEKNEIPWTSEFMAKKESSQESNRKTKKVWETGMPYSAKQPDLKANFASVGCLTDWEGFTHHGKFSYSYSSFSFYILPSHFIPYMLPISASVSSCWCLLELLFLLVCFSVPCS